MNELTSVLVAAKNRVQLRDMHVLQTLEQLAHSSHPSLRKLCTACIAQVMPKPSSSTSPSSAPSSVVQVGSGSESMGKGEPEIAIDETRELVQHMVQLLKEPQASADIQDDTATILLSISFQSTLFVAFLGVNNFVCR